MKVRLVFFVLAFLLASSFAEVEVEFPGNQPIIVAGAPHDSSDTVTGTFEEIFNIDTFSDNNTPLVITVPETGAPPTIVETSTQITTNVIGGQRDIILTIESADSNLVFSAGVANDAFNLATPASSVGRVNINYDGTFVSADITDSSNLGFSAVDLISTGGTGFEIVAASDLDTAFTIIVGDSSGNVASVTSEVLNGDNPEEYEIAFSSFSGVDFSEVIKISIEISFTQSIDFVLDSFRIVGFTEIVEVDETCITGRVLPCSTNYYEIESFGDIDVGDYFRLVYSGEGESSQPGTTGTFYLAFSEISRLEDELESNENICDTIGGLPGPDNFDYSCTESSCNIEIVYSQLEADGSYYFAVEGNGDGYFEYQICMEYSTVSIIELDDTTVGTPILFDQIPTAPAGHQVLTYSYFSIDVDEDDFGEGSFLQVEISMVEPEPGLQLRLMHGTLPLAPEDTGKIGTTDFDSDGVQIDDLVFPTCVDMTSADRIPFFQFPLATDPRIPCECFTQAELIGVGPDFQLTCSLVVDPCNFEFGEWYLSVELPERDDPLNPLDGSGFANYTISANVVTPGITELTRNTTFRAFVEPESVAHFRIDIPDDEVVPGSTGLFIHLSNIRGAFLDMYLTKGDGEGRDLAGGLERCTEPVEGTSDHCRTCDACNLAIAFCNLEPGTYYVSVEVSRDEDGNALIEDESRLPVRYTIRANWDEQVAPTPLLAGVPAMRYLGSEIYDFYVIDVPPTIDTWLFIELYTCQSDTELIMSVLFNEIPGGECYGDPDYYCLTGDQSGDSFNPDSALFGTGSSGNRESCSYMIDTCQLTAGPLYITIQGHRDEYLAYGNTTFYQIPVQYTLWADFDVALAIDSGISYSESVRSQTYQHYYIRTDQVQRGSFMSVEVTNIQHAGEDLGVYVNYNYLAGLCPCHDHLYNCTGSLCSADTNATVTNSTEVSQCCTIIVPASDFRPGVWYISVLGNAESSDFTTAIGYTLTVTVYDAPNITALLLGQIYNGNVSNYEDTRQYANFQLASKPIALSDVVIKLTYVQSCDYLGSHSDESDSLWLYVNAISPASNALGGSVYSCQVNLDTQSYCTVIIPHCEWYDEEWFVAVEGRFTADFDARFTLRASLDEVRDYQLTDGVSRYDRVSEGLYRHFFIESSAEEDEYLSIDIYTNSDQDSVTSYLMYDERAGTYPCFESMDSCVDENCCNWQILACDMRPGRYYVSVYGSSSQFYDTSVEFTLTATHLPVTNTLFNGEPFTGHLKQVGDIHHYQVTVDEGFREGSYILFEVDNVKHGAITAYAQYEVLAGRCPCFLWEYTCSASSAENGTEWCGIRIPACELQAGNYFFSLTADSKDTPSPPSFATPIGYTLEYGIVSPIIIDPTVALGRAVQFTEPFQFVADQRYNHYEFSTDDDDFSSGHHVIVEITSVQDGALFVYYNQFMPGDSADGCHRAQICTSGLGSGSECFWQLPYCLTEDLNVQGRRHYISVEGNTGRVQTSYNILIYKLQVPSIIENPSFTLDNGEPTVIEEEVVINTGNTDGDEAVVLDSEIHVTHQKNHEPNGWTRFFRLENVPSTLDEERGDLLEIFFYGITNNAGEPMTFDVYVHPELPAGAHDCCASDAASQGSCQGAPCARTVDVTTSVNDGPNMFQHTCDLGVGVGSEGNGVVNFGERCTVRVWPCEFNKHCRDRVTTWFVSVVPQNPTDILSNGIGLEYDVQFRVRNIRLDESQSIGSIDLTSAINTYEFTQAYSVQAATTESEGWLSFYVDHEPKENARLSIQTSFLSGTGTVLIQGDEFASMSPNCNQYSCSSTGACDTTERFYSSECCSFKYGRYYITIRNPVQGSTTTVQFRIVETVFPDAIDIPSHPSAAVPYVATSGSSVFSGVNGVTGDSMDTYILIIDDDDLDEQKQWYLNVERTGGDLEVFIRFQAPGGQFGADNAQVAFGEEDEGCHGWNYRCEAGQGDCSFQIPHCYLIEGHWYITISNPNFDFAVPNSLPQYQLTTFINSAPTEIPFGSVGITSTLSSSLTSHYVFNVTTDDLGFFDRDSILGYTTRFLRIQLSGISSGSVEGYVNYGGLAGASSDQTQLCSTFFSEFTCADSCFIDVTPCSFDGQELVTGSYYVAVLPGTAQFQISAQIIQTDYQEITLTETVSGEGNRIGTTDLHWEHTVTAAELASGDFRYVIDAAGPDGDDLDDDRYFIYNFTTPATTSAGTVSFSVQRDDCTLYTCSVNGPNNWCTIDALELAPCSAKGGRFYITADNPSGMTFTINLWNNQTRIQTLADSQTFMEVVYPYEYQEYEYDVSFRGDASVLRVTICSLCGEVEAFIRADAPAGPSSSSTCGESCSIDTCRADFDNGVDLSLAEPNNCCELFLDECQYSANKYFVGVRGVTQEFPNAANANLYLPAKYSIQMSQINVNVTKASLICPTTVTYTEEPATVPSQYVVNIESMNIGGMLRFAMVLPSELETTQNSTLSVQLNATVPYSEGCPLGDNIEASCETQTFCTFVVPFCRLQTSAGRVFILADAPRGTLIHVDRWEPFIPIIDHDVLYHSSINGLSTDFEEPLAPNVQYYRFDFGENLNSDPNFFEKFFARVRISGVEQGSVTAILNVGNTPVNSECGSLPTFVDQDSCSLVLAGDSCSMDIEYQVLQTLYADDSDIETTWWITVIGQEQQCEKHSITYDLIVETNTLITYFPINETICNTVSPGEFNFHRLQPHAVESPQRSILEVTISDLDPTDIVNVFIQDGSLPTNQVLTSWNENNELTGIIDAVEYICGYEDLYVTVQGVSSVDGGDIDYRMRIDKIPVPVKDLFNDSIYYADDDDDDACPHEHDFYRFKTFEPRGNHDGAFLRVLVDSEDPVEVYVHKGDFAWTLCHTTAGSNDPEISGTTSVNVYDFCDYEDAEYFITVVSNGPYYIYTHIRDDATELSIGEVHRGELEPGMYQMYTLDICDDWREADDRLVVEISDVENGDVYGWIRHDGNAGSFCSDDSAKADFGPNASGYDFLLVDSCELENGQYRILIRAGPHPASPERNCEHVTFRLYPYLIDYQIEPTELQISTPIFDSVDAYTVNRIDSGSIPFTQYYRVHPRTESDGFYEQISHAVARLSDVEGGLLSMKVMCDHLAISQYATIPGEIYGLTSFSADDEGFNTTTNSGSLLNPFFKMQSGRFPQITQKVLNDRTSQFQPECDGCSDFCCEMTYDDLDQYTTESSCAIWIPSCYFVWADFYIAVEPIEQCDIETPITYTLEVEQTRDFVLLQPNTNREGSFSNGNWDYDFFYSISSEPSAMRWRIRVTEGDGVLVTVRNHRCPLQATWTKQIWCDAEYFDQPWLCDIEIATRAQHPGDNAFFVSVYGKDADYSIAFFRGRENCHFFKGRAETRGDFEGLDFCAGFVRYGTWRWDDYTTLDNEAECFFSSLSTQLLQAEECDSGIPLQCGFALKSFACHEMFRRCDEQGFYTGVCRESCNAVVYECQNHFDTLNLEHFNCTSSRYTDSYSGTCTGGAFLAAERLFEAEDVDALRFESSPAAPLIDTAHLSALDIVRLRRKGSKFDEEFGRSKRFRSDSSVISSSIALIICLVALLI